MLLTGVVVDAAITPGTGEATCRPRGRWAPRAPRPARMHMHSFGLITTGGRALFITIAYWLYANTVSVKLP
ncbi:hypothetical protein EVAR_18841_1 [Eumeta japonica]|uniref:Uncharacterized protein n=1 Tax=Eumeta variegata TaxID=151549 RepID=A0A4C1UNE2_EUMVA|nr:hypothetical protein EVAR_18841_1 [Eumeta japonica]